jgi:hypothetical protein
MGAFYKTLSHAAIFFGLPGPAAFSAVMLVEPFHLGLVEQMVPPALFRLQLPAAYQLAHSTGGHSQEDGRFGCRNETHAYPRLLPFGRSSILAAES